MKPGNPLRVVWKGVADFGRLVSLWFGFSLATNGLTVVLHAALINEPFGWTLQGASLLALGAAFVVHSRYPEVETGTVWRFGVASFLVFVAVTMAGGAFDVRTSGSAYYVLKTLLAWIGALGVGYVVAVTDDWRALLTGE